jgi:mannose-6-phosphate isomerase-like protein (cupin superfamily)
MTETTPTTANLYDDALQRVEHCHDGAGHVYNHRLFEQRPDSPAVDFIDLVVVPPGSAIGRHRHADNEERYVVLQGGGAMLLDGRTFRVSAGDMVTNRAFGKHGLVNDSGDDILLLVFQTSSTGTGRTRRAE